MAIQRRFRSVWVVLINLIFLFVLACNSSDGVPYPDSEEQTKWMYTKHCSICHGEDGKLGLAGSPDLSISILNKEEVIAKIRNGNNEPGKVMTPFKDMLSKDEIELLTNFVIAFRE